MLIQTWAETFVFSMQDLWLKSVDFFPVIFGAFVVFVIGWVIAVVLGKGVTRLLQALQVDKLFDQLGIMKQVHKAGLDWEASAFFGALVRWFFIAVAFLATVDILGLDQLSIYLSDILLYVPNIVVAALIILIAAVLSNFLEKLAKASMKATDAVPVAFVGAVVRWSVWGFAFIAVLNQLGIASALVQILFMGFVAMLALAGGLAFGLGGQGVAKEVWEAVRDDLKDK